MSVPQTIIDEAACVAASLLPEKSWARYEHEYTEFKKWQQENNMIGITEDVVLAYINNLSKKLSPNALLLKWLRVVWQLEKTLIVAVVAFLKKRNERYVPKKAKVLTKDQVKKIILEAPDENWLLVKVITIFGIFDCCRCDELISLTLNEVEDLDKYIIVTLREIKKLTTRRFTITDDGCIFKPCAIYRKYAALRPQKSKDLQLFLTYRNGKCVVLNAAQHTLGGLPKKITEYLELQEPSLYTGHSFRRTGATIVVDASGDTFTLKRAKVWKSTQITESYMNDSINNKIELSKRLFPLKESASSTSTEYTSANTSNDLTSSRNFSISGNIDCTMIFNIYDSNKTC